MFTVLSCYNPAVTHALFQPERLPQHVVGWAWSVTVTDKRFCFCHSGTGVAVWLAGFLVTTAVLHLCVPVSDISNRQQIISSGVVCCRFWSAGWPCFAMLVWHCRFVGANKVGHQSLCLPQLACASGWPWRGGGARLHTALAVSSVHTMNCRDGLV
jgi:hypothetical protein